MTISTRSGLMQKIASGDAATIPVVSLAPGNVTAGAAGSGYITAGMNFNGLGTNQSLVLPPSPSGPLRLTSAMFTNAQVRGLYLARAYQIGTLVITSTGDQFTHHAATFPVLRTQFGQASQPVTLTPMYRVTTATTTTAAVFTIKNGAGSSGYTDQDGNTTVGTKTFTMPAAATALGGCYFPILEDGDSGVRDITQINVGTAAATGAVTVYGMEWLGLLPNHIASGSALQDFIYGSLSPANLTEAPATSGTVSSILVVMCIGTTNGAASIGHIQAVLDV